MIRLRGHFEGSEIRTSRDSRSLLSRRLVSYNTWRGSRNEDGRKEKDPLRRVKINENPALGLEFDVNVVIFTVKSVDI